MMGNAVASLNSCASVVEERLQQSEAKFLELTKGVEWTHKSWETENILKEEILAPQGRGSQLPHLIGIEKDLLSSNAPGAGSRHGERFVVENRGRAVGLIPHGGRRLVFGQRGGGDPALPAESRQPTLARSGALMETLRGERVISFGDGDGSGGVPPRPISSSSVALTGTPPGEIRIQGAPRRVPGPSEGARPGQIHTVEDNGLCRGDGDQQCVMEHEAIGLVHRPTVSMSAPQLLSL
ncbi:unnamed protein product [Gadus morhua 'NCC']